MSIVQENENFNIPLIISDKQTQQHNHKRDVHILSLMFLTIFLAYSAAQNLESSLNTDEDLGTTSLGILYLSFTFCSFFATPFVRRFGSKAALVVGTTGYWLFMASNLYPKWYTMVPTSLYLGFTASLIWVGEGTYLTFAARSHAAMCKLAEANVLGSFNGEFWGAFASTQVIGNLLSLAILQTNSEAKSTGTTLLFIVFLGSMTIGTILACFLSKQHNLDLTDITQPNDTSEASLGYLVKATFIPLLDKKMLFLIPMLVYSGLEQAFVWADFTKDVVSPAIGVKGVGGAMAVFGAADAISSLLSGHLTTSLLSITITTTVGILCQGVVLFRLWFKHSNFGSTELELVNILVVAALWGVGDGILNTQISASLGMLFPQQTEAAFSQLKIWQSGAIAIVFFVSSHIGFHAMLLVLVVMLCIAWFAFLLTTQFLVRKEGRNILAL